MASFANPQEDTNAFRVVLASGNVAQPSVVFANDTTMGLYWDVTGLHLTGLAVPIHAGDAVNKAYVDNAAPTLVAGSNITLTPSGSMLIIAASGGGSITYPLLAPDGTTIAPSYAFSNNPSSGMYYDSTNTFLKFTVGNSDVLILDGGTGQILPQGPLVVPSGMGLYFGSTASGFELTYGGSIVGSLSIGFNGINGLAIPDDVSSVSIGPNLQSAVFDGDTTAGETRMLLWDVNSNSLQRISVGVADSGGTGFKVLRIPN